MSRNRVLAQGEDGAISLSGELTFRTTPDLYETGTPLVAGASGPVRLDLAEVTTVDSSGLALMLEWQSRRPDDSGLRIVNAPSSLLRLAQLCEAVDLLNLRGRTDGS